MAHHPCIIFRWPGFLLLAGPILHPWLCLLNSPKSRMSTILTSLQHFYLLIPAELQWLVITSINYLSSTRDLEFSVKSSLLNVLSNSFIQSITQQRQEHFKLGKGGLQYLIMTHKKPSVLLKFKMSLLECNIGLNCQMHSFIYWDYLKLLTVFCIALHAHSIL